MKAEKKVITKRNFTCGKNGIFESCHAVSGTKYLY